MLIVSESWHSDISGNHFIHNYLNSFTLSMDAASVITRKLSDQKNDCAMCLTYIIIESWLTCVDRSQKLKPHYAWFRLECLCLSHCTLLPCSPAYCYGYISPGLPVGAAHLFSWEMLTLAARPASDSSEVDHVTTPSQRQAGSARITSRLSEPL